MNKMLFGYMTLAALAHAPDESLASAAEPVAGENQPQEVAPVENPAPTEEAPASASEVEALRAQIARTEEIVSNVSRSVIDLSARIEAISEAAQNNTLSDASLKDSVEPLADSIATLEATIEKIGIEVEAHGKVLDRYHGRKLIKFEREEIDARKKLAAERLAAD